MASALEDPLYRVLREVLGVESLAETSSPANVPAWDSVNHLNLILALESEYALELSLDETLEMRSVAEVRGVLRRRGVSV